jgi:hypothetical protein
LAAVVDDGQNFFVGEELVQVFDELLALHKVGMRRGMVARESGSRLLGEIIVAETFIGSLGDGLHFGVRLPRSQSSRRACLCICRNLFFVNGRANAFAL